MTAMPDFEAWVVFAKVVERGSFSAAAVDLNMAPGTVSKIIGRLEARMGATLFHRSTRRVAITPAGQALQERAATLLDDAQRLEDEGCREGTSPVGVVRLSASLAFGLSHLAPALPEFTASYPRITVDVQLHDEIRDVVEGGYDIALRIGRLRDSRLKARKLADSRTMIVAAPDYVQRYGMPADPDDLPGMPCLGYTGMPPADTWNLIDADGREATVRHRGPLCTNSGSLMMPMLLAGHGCALVPEFFVAAEIAAGRLVRLLPGWGMPPTALYLVTPSSGPRPVRVELLIDWLVDRFAATSIPST